MDQEIHSQHRECMFATKNICLETYEETKANQQLDCLLNYITKFTDFPQNNNRVFLITLTGRVHCLVYCGHPEGNWKLHMACICAMITWSTAGTKGQLEAAYGLHLCNDCLVYCRHQRATGSCIWLASVQ